MRKVVKMKVLIFDFVSDIGVPIEVCGSGYQKSDDTGRLGLA